VKVFIIGDHSDWHCGSKAIIEYLLFIIKKNKFKLVENSQEADCVLVNGEGSLHDNKRPGLKKIWTALELKREGKKVHLINSVWQNMNFSKMEDIKEFDSVCVRELISYNEIKHIRPDVKIFTDLSYFLPIKKPKMQRKEIITGGFYFDKYTGSNPDNIFKDREWVNFTKGFRCINIKDYFSWQDYITALSVAKLLISGYHHEIIAAIKLRIPFVAYRGNTDKVLGIIQRAKANIPVATTPKELFLNMKNPVEMREYDKLFDFVANEKPFDFTDLN